MIDSLLKIDKHVVIGIGTVQGQNGKTYVYFKRCLSEDKMSLGKFVYEYKSISMEEYCELKTLLRNNNVKVKKSKI